MTRLDEIRANAVMLVAPNNADVLFLLAEVDSLQARLTACEQRRGDLDLVVMKRGMEIDRLRAALYTCEQSLIVVRDNSAEARVSTLKAALERIAANHVPTTYGGGVYAFVQFARSALAALQEETPQGVSANTPNHGSSENWSR